nr:MAG: Putative vitamin uptake transporter [Bacteriophage sp.]
MIYAVISFGFGLGWVHTHEGRMQLIGIIIGQYLLKACLALLDTPFFYFFTRNADRR